MDWEKERVKKLYERERNYVESPVLRPLVNIFSGVQGDASERIKLLEKEREQKQQQLRAAQKARQREKEAGLQKRARVKATYPGKSFIAAGTTLVKGIRPNLHQTGSPALAWKKKKKINLHPTLSTVRSTPTKVSEIFPRPKKSPSPIKISLLLNLAQKLLQSIQEGDMESVARLASKIFGESA